jgi:homogentisate 1,2-dioxygenase
MNVTLDQARALDALERHGTFAAAAAALRKGHTAVLYALRTLEEQTELALLDRSGYRTALTPAGRRVLDQCRKLLAAERDLAAVCQEIRTGWEPALRVVVDGIVPVAPVIAVVGRLVAAQAHVGVPDGTVEEEYARNGFSGRYAHLYRSHAPVAWTRIEGPLRPRAFDLGRLAALDAAAASAGAAGDWLAARRGVVENADVRLSSAVLTGAMPYFFRNADADEVLFVHEGAGRIESDFGPLGYEAGDYLVVPRGTVYRLAPSSPSQLLVIETYSEVNFPDRGMLGQHALFDPAVLRVPNPEPGSALGPNAENEYELRILRAGETTRVFYPHCPLDTVGWKGTLAVTQLNVRDIRPVSADRYHLPPSAHSTFVARNAVVCTFVPRPLENGDPRAMKVPFYHSNIDFDEVLFYHRGQFFSREGISAGMLTLHPQGIHHGPQPRAAQRAASATHTNEVAVMLDTRNPLRVVPAVEPTELGAYWKSWQG